MLSWGVEPGIQPQGRVAKSIWARSIQQTDQVGLEERNFVFLPGQENKSAPEDGGLIEIQSFVQRQGKLERR